MKVSSIEFFFLFLFVRSFHSFFPFFCLLFCFQTDKVIQTFKRRTWTKPKSLCVVYDSVRLSVASHISETSEAISIKFDTVTASVMRMHHVLIILTVTLNERPSFKVTPILFMKIINVWLCHSSSNAHKFAVKTAWLKVYIIFASPMTLTYTQGHICLKLDTCFTCSLIVISRTIFKPRQS